MKRTLTAFTAAIFASALAIPAFAQVGASGDANVDTPASSTSSSSSSEYRSERTDTAPVAPPMEESRHMEHKTVTRSTTEAVPPAVVEEGSTTRRTETERSERDKRDHGVGAHVGANVGPVGAHVGAGVGSKDAGY